jgi:arylsulfatase A-like enzyme
MSAALLVALLALEVLARPSLATTPNFVVIVADDMRADDVAYVPALARLGGTTFTNAITTTPLCGPSRASLLSGLYTRHHGMKYNDPSAFADGDTLITHLAAAGYDTALVGKYLNNFDAAGAPPGWAHFVTFGNLGSDLDHYGPAQTDVLAALAVGMLPALRPPFLLYVGAIAPHKPLCGPTRYQDTPIPARVHAPSVPPAMSAQDR